MKHSTTVRLSACACAVGLLLIAGPATAQQALLVADEGTNAVAFAQQAGRIVTFICPSASRAREIWGTDAYSYDSSICTAAVHAGARTAGTSAQVSIRIGPAAEQLQGTQRNGVTSLPYPRTDYTYSFVANSEPAVVGWNTTLDRLPDDFAGPITVACPPNGNRDTTIIGTDVYRADSAICVAAVHVGLFTPEAGGRVTVSFQPKRSPLTGSVRNGVSSSSWSDSNPGAYPQPYSVSPGAVTVTARASAPAPASEPAPATTSPSSTAATATTPTTTRTPRASSPASGSSPQQSRRTAPAAATPPPPPPLSGPYNPGPRTINTSGYTARGSAPQIVPRLISTPGFTAAGTAPVIAPRTIETRGWTGSGAP